MRTADKAATTEAEANTTIRAGQRKSIDAAHFVFCGDEFGVETALLAFRHNRLHMHCENAKRFTTELANCMQAEESENVDNFDSMQ